MLKFDSLLVRDKSRAASIGEIGPEPVQQHGQAISPASQKRDMRCSPEPPRRGIPQTHTAEICDRRLTANRCEASHMSILKWRRRCCSAQARTDNAGCIAPLLHRCGRQTGYDHPVPTQRQCRVPEPNTPSRPATERSADTTSRPEESASWPSHCAAAEAAGRPPTAQCAPRCARRGCLSGTFIRALSRSDSIRRGRAWHKARAAGMHVAPLANAGHRLTLVEWEPGARTSEHDHPYGEQIFVLSGELRSRNERYPEGTWLRLHPGSRHEPFAEYQRLSFCATVI